MKGIRLFVRRAREHDAALLRSFWETESHRPAAASAVLLGFLLGTLTAAAAFDEEPGALVIRDFWVARNLRRKRVATAMLAELDGEARRNGLARLLVRPPNEFMDAFRRLGFSDGSEGLMVRTLERTR